MTAKVASKIGKVIEVIGPVLDVEFEEGHLPTILNALRVTWEVDGVKRRLTAEVALATVSAHRPMAGPEVGVQRDLVDAIEAHVRSTG